MAQENSKRIVKNTVILYARSLVVMLVALYTSRVILHALGVEDYGLYNVVGGVVGLFTFLRTSMEKCTQRFLNVEMVKPDGRLKDTFRVSFTIHLLLVVAAFILTETVGLWFLNTHIQIPEGRELAANCVYQASITGLFLTLLTIPFSACIIAHERMGMFALVSIVDACLNLGVAYMVDHAPYDRLIVYCILVLAVNIINFLMYFIYCINKFEEVSPRWLLDKPMAKQMMGYTGWTLFGHTLIIGANQGNVILVNMFHGVAANAAMAVASHVNRAVLNLTNNFQTAFNPQITKSYAKQDYENLKSLIYSTTKISFFLLLVVSLPLMFNMDMILDIWLKEVPEMSSEFCILMLASGILQATSSPLNFSVMATGRIKWFQISTGLVFLSDLIILYLLFSMGLPATTAMYVKCSIMVAVCIVRLIFAKREIPTISYFSYVRDIVLPILVATMCSITASFGVMKFTSGILSHFVAIVVIAIITLAFAYFIGLSKKERNLVLKFIKLKKSEK